MSRISKLSQYAGPFVVGALVVNGFLFCLGALSDHSRTVIVLYILFALINFLGAWKVAYDWQRHRRVDINKTQEAPDSKG